MTCSPQPDWQIDVSIETPFQKELSETWLVGVMAEALRVAFPDGALCQVSLVVADDETLQRLNREFRGLNEVTDVLSFSGSVPGRWEGDGEAPGDRYTKPGGEELPFVIPPGEAPPLGEVIISYPQAHRQALERGEPVGRELALLIVHGVLHLVGHDHQEPEEEARMKAKEAAALQAIFQVRTQKK
ncbi:MAG: rRNA maturation RNase YbeY [Chloroflexota bacterium]